MQGLKLFSDCFRFPSISISFCLRDSFPQLLASSLPNEVIVFPLPTIHFNNLLEGPLTITFYHIINDDSISPQPLQLESWTRPYYSPVMKCNGVVIGPHYTRSGNIRRISLSQWALLLTHSPFFMQAIIQITFQLPPPISVFHFKISLHILRL